jgi:hypothetical protein
MLFSLDKNPSPKTLVALIILGAVLFLPSFAALNLLIHASGADPAEFAAAWRSLDGRRIADYYARAGNGLAIELVGCSRVAGSALFGFAGTVYLARRVRAGRAFTRLCYSAALVAPAAALSGLFETTVILAALSARVPIPDPLLAPALVAMNLEGVVWIAFLWMLFLAVYLLVATWTAKRKAGKVAPR